MTARPAEPDPPAEPVGAPVGSPTQLIVVRHGESTGNLAAARAEEQGEEMIAIDVRDADVPLSPTGITQAVALGHGLAAMPARLMPTRVWSSPYVRARETAATALRTAAIRVPWVVDERLRDRELGVLDLLTRHGVEMRHPDEAARRRWLGKFYHRPPGGESWADLVLRVRSVLADLVARSEGERVLVVCHDAVVLAIRYVCEGMSEAEVLDLQVLDPVKNVSITRLEQRTGPEGAHWALLQANDVTHLHAADAPVTSHPGDTDAHPQ